MKVCIERVQVPHAQGEGVSFQARHTRAQKRQSAMKRQIIVLQHHVLCGGPKGGVVAGGGLEMMK